jgi:hypothetical protein
MLSSLVDPTAPFVSVSCNDDTITAICFAPRCHEVLYGHPVLLIKMLCLMYFYLLMRAYQVVIASRSSFVRICSTVDGTEMRKFRVVGGVVQVRESLNDKSCGYL